MTSFPIEASPFTAIPSVLDVAVVRGTHASESAPPDLVIEIPHGATRTSDFTALGTLLESPLPKNLIDFFHVNTDTGAFELGDAIARAFVAAEPSRTVAILRCRVPRTFIDCNRRIDASPADFKEGRVTPGLMPWITSPADRALLNERHAAYASAVDAAAERVMTAGGAMLLLHSYAPREVDVEVDLDIVEKLHHAYLPEVVRTWKLRPEVDVIGRDTSGVSHVPAVVFGALRDALGEIGIDVADSATYPLHPSTLAWGHVTRWPGRALCVEVRRDLLADPFDPFVEMRIGVEKVRRIAGPIAGALRRWW